MEGKRCLVVSALRGRCSRKQKMVAGRDRLPLDVSARMAEHAQGTSAERQRPLKDGEASAQVRCASAS